MVARLQAPIVLAHGLFGFARIGLGPLTLTTYFRGIPDVLRAAGNRVLVTRVHPIAGVEFRARRLGDRILRAFPEEPVHIIGHSMGGLDARRLLADPFWRKRVLSLTTIGTPHLGTYLADFAKLKVGRVYRLLELMRLDPRGFIDITRRSARRFHRLYKQPRDIPCFSLAGDPPSAEVTWPLQRLHALMGELEGPNDGLVSVASAEAFGTVLPCWPADHLRQMNWMTPMPGSTCPPVPDLYAQILDKLAALGFASTVEDVACEEPRPSAPRAWPGKEGEKLLNEAGQLPGLHVDLARPTITADEALAGEGRLDHPLEKPANPLRSSGRPLDPVPDGTLEGDKMSRVDDVLFAGAERPGVERAE